MSLVRLRLRLPRESSGIWNLMVLQEPSHTTACNDFQQFVSVVDQDRSSLLTSSEYVFLKWDGDHGAFKCWDLRWWDCVCIWDISASWQYISLAKSSLKVFLSHHHHNHLHFTLLVSLLFPAVLITSPFKISINIIFSLLSTNNNNHSRCISTPT